jgi:RNA polymerase sigma-70 factor (ECF subfamily)
VKPADLARLFVTEAPRLMRRLRRFRGRVAEEDVVQSAFAKLLEVDMSGIDDPRAYLARLVRNLAIDEVRRQDRVKQAPVSDAELEELLAKRPGPYDRLDLTPEEMLIAGEQFAHMTAVFLNLPERERSALVLFKFGGLSHEEIGVRLGVSRHSVPGLLARALAKCAKAMAAFEDGPLKEIADEVETKRKTP